MAPRSKAPRQFRQIRLRRDKTYEDPDDTDSFMIQKREDLNQQKNGGQKNGYRLKNSG
jgi:hypothetical protein